MNNMQDNEQCELPDFIDKYIFSKLGASYSPSFEKFGKNLEHEKEEVLGYLGTYFPRSFAEAYTIFNNIFDDEKINNCYLQMQNKDINILDIGSGTGGNLSGLLYSFIEHFGTAYNFNIFVIDGNNDALIVLEKIILQFQSKYDGVNISITKHHISFNSISDLYGDIKEQFSCEFDFIVSSKMLNEIITEDRNAYYNFYDCFCSKLKEKGILIIADITNKIDNCGYIPIIINNQTNKFIKENLSEYKTLIPIPCSLHEAHCAETNCFTNIHLSVSHTNNLNNMSRIVCRAIGRLEFVENILRDIEISGIVGRTRDGDKYCLYENK